MEQLLKHALDNDAVGFINRLKDKMSVHHTEERETITREVAADIAGVEVQEAEKLTIKTNKGEVSIKDNDSIEYEAKPGVVRIGMAWDVLSKGVKFKKGGKWHVVEATASKDPMHVFVSASGKGIKWRTSDQRTGGEANFTDPKDEKALRAYFQKVFGKKKEFTLEIRESEE